jgi:hypothetical protein
MKIPVKNGECNGNGENKYLKILYNQVTFVLAIVGIAWTAFNYTNVKPQQIELKIQQIEATMIKDEALAEQLKNIKDNDLHTIELRLSELTNLQIETQKEIVELRTLVKLHMGIK